MTSGRWQRPIRSRVDAAVQVDEVALEVCSVMLPRRAVHAWRGMTLQRHERVPEQVDIDVMLERCEPLRLPFPGCGPYAVERL